MDGATIFVLALTAGFFSFIAYLAITSRRSITEQQDSSDNKQHHHVA